MGPTTAGAVGGALPRGDGLAPTSVGLAPALRLRATPASAGLTHLGRRVARAEGEKLARENNLMFMETSARTGEGVQEMFEKVAEAIISNKSSWGSSFKYL